jgi:hypothetical protein
MNTHPHKINLAFTVHIFLFNMLSVGLQVFIILNLITCYRNHIFIHRGPLTASLTIWKHNVSFLQGLRTHPLPLISAKCETAAQACVMSHKQQVDSVCVLCVCTGMHACIWSMDVCEKHTPWTHSFQLQYFCKLDHGKNATQSFVNKIPLKVPHKRMQRIVKSLWMAGLIMDKKEIQKWYVLTEEELIFVVVCCLKWGVKIHISMAESFYTTPILKWHPYNFCFYTAK